MEKQSENVSYEYPDSPLPEYRFKKLTYDIEGYASTLNDWITLRVLPVEQEKYNT